MSPERLRPLLATAVLAMALGPVGTAVFVLGFVSGDSPCVLCWAQRSSMALIALAAVFILRFGPRPRYIGLGVLLAAHGLYMAVRHSSLHVARDVGQGFAVEILGFHTYVWSALVFWVALAAMGALLLVTPDGAARAELRPLGRLDRVAAWVLMVTLAANAVQAFASTGPPPFMGQSDPVRFSFDPRRWVWSLEEWRPAPISWRGRWDVETPSLEGLERDPGRGPLSALPVLAPERRMRLPVELEGSVAGLAYDPARDRFLFATDDHHVFVLDGALQHVERETVVDPLFSVDLSPFAGAAFRGDELVLLGRNKSFVVLRASDSAGIEKNFRYFLESFDQFDEVARGRFATVRARMGYVMSFACDPAGESLYTVTVPSRRYPRLVVSRFDAADRTLSEEFSPTPGPGLTLAGPERSLNEYYVTGAAVAGGRLYAVSAAFSTLLVVDLGSRRVVEAFALDGLTAPAALALRGEELLVAETAGEVVVYTRPTAEAPAE